MSEGLKVDFAEIDRMTNGLTELNTWALPLVPKVGAISADGDLLASAILSPGSAVAAESAALTASVQLGVTVASTEALVVVTASIVKVYQTAELALAVAATTIQVTVTAAAGLVGRVAVDVLLSVKTGIYTVVTLAAVTKEAVDSGLVADVASIAAHSLKDAFDSAMRGDASLADRFQQFSSDAAKNFSTNFAAALPGLSPKIVAVEQESLGDLRKLGVYDDLLSTLIADGQRFGFFEDGRPKIVTDAIEPDKLTDRRDTALVASTVQTGQSFTTDADGNIVPTDVGSLFASSSQIDNIGQDDFADVRIIKSIDVDGTVRYTVQIPSTQSWDPTAGATPNDLTSDAMAMRFGNNSALSRGVLDAMKRAGIEGEPVMMTGFSLGGITAGAIAADPHGYNIQQVVTAGSPIGAMDIPSTTRVTSLESVQDPIAGLDGVDNPSSWSTVRGDAPTKLGESVSPTLASAHDANRYSVMASGNPAVNDDGSIVQFLGGSAKTTTVTDYQIRRTN
ncbi:hypothetical protein [Curtobacterium sp. MCBA15_001]|uniref:hypothetical protein n=1 Tax=Curtobacterium sp. MCBA15_001 TaxID=1898731 RepID=UPI0008DD6038|nr:hypothetical protein [Curtobacterium sp. MCBA15_001]OIH97346.1 hypothetical protein BIU90_15710 [Curtobacterium sp. MCBA15_001]